MASEKIILDSRDAVKAVNELVAAIGRYNTAVRMQHRLVLQSNRLSESLRQGAAKEAKGIQETVAVTKERLAMNIELQKELKAAFYAERQKLRQMSSYGRVTNKAVEKQAAYVKELERAKNANDRLTSSLRARVREAEAAALIKNQELGFGAKDPVDVRPEQTAALNRMVAAMDKHNIAIGKTVTLEAQALSLTQRFNQTMSRKVAGTKESTDALRGLIKENRAYRESLINTIKGATRKLHLMVQDADTTHEDVIAQRALVEALLQAGRASKDMEKALQGKLAAERAARRESEANARAQKELAERKQRAAAASKKLQEQTRALRLQLGLLGTVTNRVGSIIKQFTIVGGLLALVQAMKDSIGTAKEFSKALAEIGTISQQAGVTTARWASELTDLSNAFGIDVVTAAEAAYQTLSNQILDTGSDAFPFLKEEAKLAAIAVSTLDDAVQATSSVLNAFGMETSEAAQVNAILFQTIEQGRTRLKDFANTLGRVSVLSKQLGISFIEQETALSFLTRQGIKMDEAMTLVRNVQLRLLKPTEKMEEIFRSWGLTSGQAAIQSLGLVGVLQQLAMVADENGDLSAELGQSWGRLRAMVGAAALSTSEFTKEFDRFKGAGEKAANALEISLGSMSTRADIHLQQFRNYLRESFGEKALKWVLDLVDSFGGAANTLDYLTKMMRAVALSAGSYSLVLAIVAAKQRVVIAQNIEGAKAMTFFQKSMTFAGGIFGKFNVVSLAGGLALSVLIEKLFLAKPAAEQLATEIQHLSDQTNAMSDKIAAVGSSRFFGALTDQSIDFQQAVREVTREYGTFVAQIERRNMEVADDFKATYKKIAESMTQPMAEASRKIGRDVEKALNDAKGRMDDADAAFKRLKGEQTSLAIDTRINLSERNASGATDIAGVRAAYAASLADMNKAAAEALASGDRESYRQIKDGTLELMRAMQQRFAELQKEAEKMEDIEFPIGVDRTTGQLQMKKIGEKPKDAALGEAAAREVLNVQKEITKVVQDRIDTERKFYEEQKKAAADDLKRAEAQQKKLEQFQELLAQIDSFEGDATGLRGLLTKADAQAQGLGIDPTERIKLLRDGYAAEQKLLAKQAADASAQQTQQARKDIQLLEEKIQKQEELVKQSQQKEFLAAQDEIKKQIDLLAQFERATKKERDSLRRLGNDPIDNLFSFTGRAENFKTRAADTTKILQTIQGQLFALRSALKGKDLDKLRELLQADYAGQAEGALRSRPGFATELKALEKLIRESKTGELSQGESLGLERELNRMVKDRNNLLKELGTVMPDIAEESRTAWKQAATEAQSYDAVLDRIRKKLIEARALQNQPVFQPQPKAFGGRIGFDNQAALLRKGEMVMNPIAVRRFGPQLEQINRGNSTTINFGDINLNQSGSPSGNIVNAVIRELRRLDRLNLV